MVISDEELRTSLCKGIGAGLGSHYLIFCPEGLYLLKGVRGKTDDILLGHVIILGLHVLFAYLFVCYIVTLCKIF